MTADRVRELKQLIADLRDRYGFEEDRPDPVALAEAMHVRVRYFPLGDLRGFYLVLNDIPFIAIDRDIPEALQRVVCAHELGHHLLHHEEASRGFFDDYDLYRMENRFERDANLFASLLLLPDRAVEEFCRPENRGLSVKEAARLRETTEELFAIRLGAEGLDTGDMISKVKVDIRGKDIIEVADLLAEAGADLLAMTIPQIENGSAAYTSQNEEEATYSHLIKKSDGYTDFNESAVQIERKIRAYADWPSCYTYIDGGLQLKLYKAEAIPGESSTYAPGTVSAVDKHDYTISCQEGSLKVLEQQLQGKKRMGAGDFMRGHKLTPGDRFCAEEDK